LKLLIPCDAEERRARTAGGHPDWGHRSSPSPSQLRHSAGFAPDFPLYMPWLIPRTTCRYSFLCDCSEKAVLGIIHPLLWSSYPARGDVIPRGERDPNGNPRALDGPHPI